jgi:hypothetical protein
MKYSPEKELKVLSMSVIITGIVLIVLAFLPVNLYTQISMKVVITFLIASGISVMCRAKWAKKR